MLKVNHNGRSSTLRRPIQCLYPLEVAEQRVLDELPSKVTQDTKQDKSVLDTRCHKPVRDAAVQARQRVRDWTTKLTDIV